MLVRHLKSDQKCAAHCSYLELDSFDKQLKRFRHKRQCAEMKRMLVRHLKSDQKCA